MLNVKDLGRLLKKTSQKWIRDEPLRESAVVAYFAIFSIPALLVLVFNLAGLFIEKKRITSEVMLQVQTSINPRVAEILQAAVQSAGNVKEGVFSTIAGVAIILFAATRVFVHLQKTLNRIWDVKQTGKRGRQAIIQSLFSIGLILAIGILVLVSMALNVVLTTAGQWVGQSLADEVMAVLKALEFVVSFFLTGLLFTLVFKYLPAVRVPWPAAIAGSLVTTVLFIVLRFAISAYFVRVQPGSVYGAAAAVVLIMLWVTISSMALFFGAEFSKQYARHLDPENAQKKESPSHREHDRS